MKTTLLPALTLLTLAMTCQAVTPVPAAASTRTFPPHPEVAIEKVKFVNRLGIELDGDMFIRKDADRTAKHPVIIVGHPFGAVKEQPAGLYAQELARRGFVTLAFDASYFGESGGEPRLTVSPEADVEDFSAAVDFMGTRPFVERTRIGALGICGSGAFAISAAAIDPRIRAVATVSMYDMGRTRRQGVGDVMTEEERRAKLVAIGEQRWKEYEGAEPKIQFGTPPTLPENPSEVTKSFFAYYRNPERGLHPNYKGTRFTSDAALMNFFPFHLIDTISPRPILFVVGEKAHSRYFSDDAYNLAAEPKELFVVPGAGHVDLYDQMDKIPFDRIEAFFRDSMK